MTLKLATNNWLALGRRMDNLVTLSFYARIEMVPIATTVITIIASLSLLIQDRFTLEERVW